MPTCKKCNTKFPMKMEIDGKIRNFGTRKYCLKCSPFGQHNTKVLHLRDLDDYDVSCPNVARLKDPQCKCLDCGRGFIYNKSQGHRRTLCNSCSVRRAQRKRKKKIVDTFGGKCIHCGYDRCYDALEFHHPDSNVKTETPSYIISKWSFERAIKELRECDLVCANCHREIHHKINHSQSSPNPELSGAVNFR